MTSTPYAGVLGQSALCKADLLICQGATNVWSFTYSTKSGDDPAVPVDLSVCSARMQVRKKVAGDLWLSFTDADGIALGDDGTIVITITPADTTGDEWTSRVSREDQETGELSYVGLWDLELEFPDGTVKRFAEGRVQVDPDVTR